MFTQNILHYLVSPKAYVSASAQVGQGCIIEPMSVVHTKVCLGKGCFISAGAIINHDSKCGDCVHVDCHATVVGYSAVPAETKVCSGEIFR